MTRQGAAATLAPAPTQEVAPSASSVHCQSREEKPGQPVVGSCQRGAKSQWERSRGPHAARTQPRASRQPRQDRVSHCVQGASQERQSVLLNSHFLRYPFCVVTYFFFFTFFQSFRPHLLPLPSLLFFLLLLLRVAFPPSNPTIIKQPI